MLTHELYIWVLFWFRSIILVGQSELLTMMASQPSQEICLLLKYATWVLSLEMNGVLQEHLTEKMVVVSWQTIFLVPLKLSGTLRGYMLIHLRYQVNVLVDCFFSNVLWYKYNLKNAIQCCHSHDYLCWIGVRFPGLTHPGIIGTAPSMELLNIWNERERDVEENGVHSFKLCEVLHSRPLASLPTTNSCLLGKVMMHLENINEFSSFSKCLHIFFSLDPLQ